MCKTDEWIYLLNRIVNIQESTEQLEGKVLKMCLRSLTTSDTWSSDNLKLD